MAKRKSKSNRNKKKQKSEEEVEVDGQYWAEEIRDWGLHDTGRMMYLVKWEGYPESENSWEFEAHVKDCEHLLTQFHMNTVNGRHPPKYSFDEYNKLCEYLENSLTNKDLAVFKALSKREVNSFDIRSVKVIEDIKDNIKTQLTILDKNKNLKTKTNSKRLEIRELREKAVKALNINRNFGSITEFFEFADKRLELLKKLKEWEDKQNKVIDKNKEGKAISIVNDVDLEIPQLKEYITDYIIDVQFGNEIKLEEEEPLVSCQCDNCYESRDECCTAVIGFPMVYNSKGLLSSLRFNTIIFECNSKCKCDQNCPNRQIQRGRQYDLEIFRTDSKVRGWGVRSLQTIPKGAFITQYTGEVISLKEAEKRPTTYLFDLSTHLDSSDVEFTYVVDASQYGNVTRFVNHSCAPNCRVLFAWIKRSTNKLLPMIALFAVKQIRPNEELTYDYSMELIDFYNQSPDSMSESSFESSSDMSESDCQNSDDSDVNQRSQKRTDIENKEIMRPTRQVHYTKIECECGATNCCKFLYS